MLLVLVQNAPEMNVLFPDRCNSQSGKGTTRSAQARPRHQRRPRKNPVTTASRIFDVTQNPPSQACPMRTVSTSQCQHSAVACADEEGERPRPREHAQPRHNHLWGSAREASDITSKTCTY